VTNENDSDCKRPYSLGRRLEQSDLKRAAVLKAARGQLELGGYLTVTMDSLARESGVTRQTVHNLFKTKAGVLEALFDQLALDGGMEQMASVMHEGMRGTDSRRLIEGFVQVFTGFWSRDRLLIRRIHGIAAIDPEFGAAVQARNARRRMVAARIVGRFESGQGDWGVERRREQGARAIAAVYAITSFEFFDALAESLGSLEDASETVLELARDAMGLRSE
jgi:AcrR family transcriptional regulator